MSLSFWRSMRNARLTLPDGSSVPRLPMRTWWICDTAGFAGQISLRWAKGTEALPATCLGHIGYAVRPERQGQGLATRALTEVLPIAAAVGLANVEITCREGNAASRRVPDHVLPYLGHHDRPFIGHLMRTIEQGRFVDETFLDDLGRAIKTAQKVVDAGGATPCCRTHFLFCGHQELAGE
ncbi:GNAT family N-acetyltransferase [Pararhodobacter sp. SW119]|uniref:GNAT family N-acetyltransferase n=1 Tax=Pararhodobacter sp. SW119 TaxID=2780075 RepID=UPI001ADF67A7|nr:GNAT family N-acetyltransferase [Pararhodobacter sp. SW119]